MTTMSRLRAAAMTVLATLVATPAAAGYPEKPVRIVIPYSPGGATDNITRIVFQQVQKILNGVVVIESKPGGNGLVALNEVVRAKPDGYTLLVGNNTTNSIVPVLYDKKMPFDVRKALIPITRIGDAPGVIVATKVRFPPNTLPEVMQYAKENPDKLNCIIGAIGSAAHLAWLVIQQETGARFITIPAKGGMGPAVTDLLNGDAHFAAMSITQALPLVQAGRLKALAISAERRLPSLPDVPTVRETGLNADVFGSWQAAFAPAGTPKPIVDTVFRAIRDAVRSPEVQEAFRTNEIVDSTNESPEAFAAYLETDMARWRRIIASTNVQID